jgi:hypothetical protein
MKMERQINMTPTGHTSCYALHTECLRNVFCFNVYLSNIHVMSIFETPILQLFHNLPV